MNKRLANDYGLDPKEFIGKPLGFRSLEGSPDLATDLQQFLDSPQQSSQKTIFLDQKQANAAY